MKLFVLPAGYILDAYGTLIYRSVATCFMTLALILTAISSPSTSGMLFPAMILLGICGFDLLIGNFQIANLTISARSLVINLLDGFYSSSAVVWLLIKIAYENGISLRTSFICLSICTVLLWIRTFFLMPVRGIPSSIPEENYKYTLFDLFIRKDTHNYEKIENEGTCCKIQGFSTKFQTHLRNPLFWSNAFWYSFIVLRLIFYYGTMVTWLEGITPPSRVSFLINISGIIICCAALASPLNGAATDLVTKYFLRKYALGTASACGLIVSTLITNLSYLGLSIAVVTKQTYLSFVMLVLTQTCVFGSSDSFLAILFPAEDFGKLFGCNEIIGGLIALLQFPLFKLSILYDPSFDIVNYSFVGICIFICHSPIVVV